MAVVAQLVRALVCGAGGRGFEPHRPPFLNRSVKTERFFCFVRFLAANSRINTNKIGRDLSIFNSQKFVHSWQQKRSQKNLSR